MVPFIPFVVGTFLSDYQTSDFVLVSGARNAADVFGVCFIILFLLSNIQAAIIFSILVMNITIILLIVASAILSVLGAFCVDYDEESRRKQHQQDQCC